ncbi:MAG: hypothetical protein IJZ53_01345 [Tyzzerella sp.]|nr:hypothetical protein [Tyzzerella sp.]
MKLFKKKRKHKYINGTKGVISIFLCLIMTPVLSLASVLIEFSRYQNTEAIFQEVMDCASLSTMANYDSYLEERFGLFAVSQDCNINETYKNSLLQNSLVMEGITLGTDITATGMLPLSDTDIIKRQILDFSESTVLTEIILEDLQLQALLDELDKIMAIGGLTQTLTDMNTMTTKIKELVQSGETLVGQLESAVNQVETVKNDANAFAKAIADLYQKINTDGFSVDMTTEDSEEASYEQLIEAYIEDIKTVYEKSETLVSSVNTLKDLVTALPNSLSALKVDYDEAVAAVDAVINSTTSLSSSSNTGSAGQGESNIGEVADESTSLYQQVINEIGSAIDEATEQLSTTTVESLKTAAEGFAEQLVEGLGLDVTKCWNLEEYYALPLSDEAQEDLQDILSELPTAWEEGSYNGILQTLKDKYVPSVFNMSLSQIKDTINDAVTDAKNQFVDRVESSVGEILTNLVNTINGLFDLDVFYDGSLNAYLNDETVATLLSDSGERGADEENPYVSLLNALASMMAAVDSFNSAISGLDFFELIDAVANLCSSIKSTVEAVVQLTANTVEKISELVGYVANGEWEKFGELILMSGYMTHNLPNRTMAGRTEVTVDGSIAYQTVLDGETLTGFPYSNIKTPAKVLSTGIGESAEEGESSLNALVDFLNDSLEGGTDKMFRGAELEYILAGTQSELMNQTVVFMQIYFLRLLLDLVSVFTDPAVTTMASAATIACWAVYLIEVFAEPLCDTVLLVNGSEEVSFVKKSCYLTPTGLPTLASQLSSVVINNAAISQSAVDAFNSSTQGKFDAYTKAGLSFSSGILPMDYSTHCLLILMFTTTTDDMLRRVANLAQLEANYYYSQGDTGYSFDITKAYTGISASADVEFDSFIKLLQTNTGLIKKKFTRTNTY